MYSSGILGAEFTVNRRRPCFSESPPPRELPNRCCFISRAFRGGLSDGRAERERVAGGRHLRPEPPRLLSSPPSADGLQISRSSSAVLPLPSACRGASNAARLMSRQVLVCSPSFPFSVSSNEVLLVSTLMCHTCVWGPGLLFSGFQNVTAFCPNLGLCVTWGKGGSWGEPQRAHQGRTEGEADSSGGTGWGSSWPLDTTGAKYGLH
ncbi:unnamed protein product [Rangifer tarandus platyrhynchus]|uniref:Uncharacterized protein n=1 Tax=Rangifer tarandus platyrhynchus TaxID=3082113 RepID=A0ABN8YTL3_RANTA|nr:unnamed protein product [Rangifer tarandus platyrhynchus]